METRVEETEMLTDCAQWKGHAKKKGEEAAQDLTSGRQEAADIPEEAQCPTHPGH
jgi:hypothetical protein